MSGLLVVVPSRGRPGSIKRLWETMQATCRAGTTLLVGLDDDDPAQVAYPSGPEYEVRGGLRQVVAWINALAVPRAGDYDAIGHFGDDQLPRTDGWDEAMLECLQTAPFAFGNDLAPRAPGSLCCHIFMRSAVIDALGYMGPPSLRHMYVDPVWQMWGEATGIVYRDDVILEHLHYSTGKSQFDETYAASLAQTEADRQAFNAYCQDPAGLNADIEKIKGVA